MADVFRKEYKTLSEEAKSFVLGIKEEAEILLDLINSIDLANTPQSIQDKNRCIALARTNLEQAIMWATKAITS